MNATVMTMPKQPSHTEQVRIPVSLTTDARMVASAFKKSLPQYVEEAVRQAVARDFAKAVKIMAKRSSTFTDAKTDEAE